jgi:predicted N-acyltransferase
MKLPWGMISKSIWDAHQPNSNPFLNFAFMDALIQSNCVNTEKGWTPNFITQKENGVLLSFIKNHSYGEYIFDWGWAEAYQKYGVPYYPKLTSLIPFTPVTTQHFLMKDFDEKKASLLLKEHDDFYDRGEFSSAHFLFLNDREIEVFRQHDYMIRESMQYHFFNQNYENFEDFLTQLKSKKAKNIRHERSLPQLKIKKYTAEELTKEHGKRMYQFYISTIANKHSFDYLNAEFFELIFERMKPNILYVEATLEGQAIAGSLFFYDHEKLYGRYWGSSMFVENLHFELCYYQGIDFCIEKGLKVFEAGAQGEHKIARGFRPIKTYSAHKIKHPGFQDAIHEFIENEKRHVSQNIEELSKYLPFKSH